MQIYLLKLPSLNDVFIANTERLKHYLHTDDYGLLAVKNNSQMASALGKIMVQYLLGKQKTNQGKISPFSFAYTKEGKPYIPMQPNFCFNISHTKEWVAVAVTDTPIGIDIEMLRVYKPEVAKRFFHKDEYAFLESLPNDLRNVSFTRLWTVKESYVKCTGTGIANNFDKFAISMNFTDVEITGNDTPVFFKQYNCDGLFVSVCSTTNLFPNNIMLLTIEEILTAL